MSAIPRRIRHAYAHIREGTLRYTRELSGDLLRGVGQWDRINSDQSGTNATIYEVRELMQV